MIFYSSIQFLVPFSIAGRKLSHWSRIVENVCSTTQKFLSDGFFPLKLSLWLSFQAFYSRYCRRPPFINLESVNNGVHLFSVLFETSFLYFINDCLFLFYFLLYHPPTLKFMHFNTHFNLKRVSTIIKYSILGVTDIYISRISNSYNYNKNNSTTKTSLDTHLKLSSTLVFVSPFLVSKRF